jgi:hypothetical protein
MLSACGSDDDATPVAGTPPAAAATADDDAGEVSAEPAGSDDFCAALAAYSIDASDDPLADAAELEQLASIAPPEIADDMQSIAELTSQIMDFDEMTASEEDVAEFEALISEFDPAAARLGDWAVANCPEAVID